MSSKLLERAEYGHRIAQWYEQERRPRGWNKTSFANALGINAGNLHKYFSGELDIRRLTTPLLRLGCPVQTLFCDTLTLPMREHATGALPVGFPLFESTIPAGIPASPDASRADLVDLNAMVAKKDKTTFILRVNGDSMIGAGIHHNDLLFVDQEETARDGRIVVALINGETTVKRLRLLQGKTWLMPENSSYPPIEIRDTDDFKVIGVARISMHSLE